MNLKFVISYDGSLYQGSQKQPNGMTVEDKLLKAFKRVNIETNNLLVFYCISLHFIGCI